MAGKSRDYKGENERRNDKYKNFGGYSKVRKGLKSGDLIRDSSGKVVAYDKEFTKGLPAWQRAGASSTEEYMKMKKEVNAWIKKYPSPRRYMLDKDQLKDPKLTAPGRSIPDPELLKDPEVMGAYYFAYVKRPHPPGALKHYLVNVTGRVSVKEWEKNYAKRFKAN